MTSCKRKLSLASSNADCLYPRSKRRKTVEPVVASRMHNSPDVASIRASAAAAVVNSMPMSCRWQCSQQSVHVSEFSVAESSQFSSQLSQFSQFSQLSIHSMRDNPLSPASSIPTELLQLILEFCSLLELSTCASVNRFFNAQSGIMLTRLRKCTISPACFPTLISDDYDSQFEYNPDRNPSRTHSTLNRIIEKLQQSSNLRSLTIQRTVATSPLFAQLLRTSASTLVHLTLDENPFLFLQPTQQQSADQSSPNPVNPPNLVFPNSLHLQSFHLNCMYLNTTQQSFQQLLHSSRNSLQSLILCKRDPFQCSLCHRRSLCKWHKCQDCQLRSYCSRQCQSADWWQHQYVCAYHDPNNIIRSLQRATRLRGGFLHTISSLHRLERLDLTWSFVVDTPALLRIAANCLRLREVVLNGCDASAQGVQGLVKALRGRLEKLCCRGSRFVDDGVIDGLVECCADSLKELDVTRCVSVTKQACLKLVKGCERLEVLSMACGVRRGKWMWCMDDEIAESVVARCKQLKRLEYVRDVGCGSGLSVACEREMWMMNGGLRVQRIIAACGVGVRAGSDDDGVTVLEEYIEDGRVVYSQKFRR